MNNNPVAYILVGIPGAGKSTWIINQRFDPATTITASSDFHVDKYAVSLGKTYSEVFDEFMPTAISNMLDDVQYGIDNACNIVWDQTSTTIGSRKKKLRIIPPHYKKIAVVFTTPTADVLSIRLNNRPGKHIPATVISNMIKHFQTPVKSEGFDEIMIINN